MSLRVKEIEQEIDEALGLKKDSVNKRIIVYSDLTDPKAAKMETINNRNIFKNPKYGFKWDAVKMYWWKDSTDPEALNAASEMINTVNKTNKLIAGLEELEEFINADTNTAVPTSEKQELVQKVDSYIEHLANMTDEAAMSEEIKKYLAFQAKFYKYSFNNTILIWIQKPNATRVASFTAWKKLGRGCKKGTAIYIWRPIIDNKSKNADGSDEIKPSDEDALGKTKSSQPSGFVLSPVFDISDTYPYDGKELEQPEMPQWWRDSEPDETADEMYGYIVNISQSLGIKVTNDAAIGGEKGYSAGMHINITSGVEGAARLGTMIHEVAHELMHRKTGPFYVETDSRGIKELHAESVSYVVLKHYGIESNHSTTYLALWRSNKEKIQQEMSKIGRTAKWIIEKIDDEAEKNPKNQGEVEKEQPIATQVTESKKVRTLTKAFLVEEIKLALDGKDDETELQGNDVDNTVVSDTDCRSEVGITVGLIDSLISICRILKARDLTPQEVQEALMDLGADEDLNTVLNATKEITNNEEGAE